MEMLPEIRLLFARDFGFWIRMGTARVCGVGWYWTEVSIAPGFWIWMALLVGIRILDFGFSGSF